MHKELPPVDVKIRDRGSARGQGRARDADLRRRWRRRRSRNNFGDILELPYGDVVLLALVDARRKLDGEQSGIAARASRNGNERHAVAGESDGGGSTTESR